MAATRENPLRYKQAIKAGERKLDELFKALGVRTYALMQQGGLQVPDLSMLKNEIDSTNTEILSNRENLGRYTVQKQAARGAICPNCGQKAPPGMLVCPYCNTEMFPTFAEPMPAVYMEQVSLVPCLVCGGEIAADATFCGLCGSKVVEQVVEGLGSEPASKVTPGQPRVVAPPAPPTPPAQQAQPAPPSPAQAPTATPAPQAPIAKSDTNLRDKPPSPPGAATAEPSIPHEPSIEMQTCKKCGETQRAEAVFCFNCGQRLVG